MNLQDGRGRSESSDPGDALDPARRDAPMPQIVPRRKPSMTSNRQPTTSDDLPRQMLPIPDRKHVGLTTFEATDPDTSYPPITALRPPAGAPNVLVILLDDVGFGASSRALVADDYPVPNTFTGEVNWVEIDVGTAAVDADHRIHSDELLRVAMARQ